MAIKSKASNKQGVNNSDVPPNKRRKSGFPVVPQSVLPRRFGKFLLQYGDILIFENKLRRLQADGIVFYSKFYYNNCYYDVMMVDPRLTPENYFLTVIHELLHLFMPQLSEREVDMPSRHMAKILRALGYGYRGRPMKIKT